MRLNTYLRLIRRAGNCSGEPQSRGTDGVVRRILCDERHSHRRGGGDRQNQDKHGGMILSRNQRPEGTQVSSIGLVLNLFGRFQQLGDAAEALVVEKEGKSVEADLTVADVLVTVDA